MIEEISKHVTDIYSKGIEYFKIGTSESGDHTIFSVIVGCNDGVITYRHRTTLLMDKDNTITKAVRNDWVYDSTYDDDSHTETLFMDQPVIDKIISMVGLNGFIQYFIGIKEMDDDVVTPKGYTECLLYDDDKYCGHVACTGALYIQISDVEARMDHVRSVSTLNASNVKRARA